MRLICILALILVLATSALCEVQILWDVPLDTVAQYDSTRHIQLLPDGRVALWGSLGEEYLPYHYGMGGYVRVCDTLGTAAWSVFRPSDQRALAGIYDLQVQGSEVLFAWGYLEDVFKPGVFGLSRYSLNGDSLWSHTWDMTGELPEMVAISPDRTYFGYLHYYGSFAPVGRILAVSNTGDSLWTQSIWPDYGDNNNHFFSLRWTEHSGLVLTYRIAWQTGTNYVATFDENGESNTTVMGSVDTLRLYDAFELANGDLWTVGIVEGNFVRKLYIQNVISMASREIPLFEGVAYCQVDRFVARADSGLLVVGHLANQDAAHAFVMNVSSRMQEVGADTQHVADYSRITDLAVHPDGGYLAVAISGTPARYHLVRLVETSSGVPEPSAPQPSSLQLPAYPNPFNPATILSFTLPRASHISVKVYDLAGRLVVTLADERFEAGEHQVTFHASGMASGIYFVRMETANRIETAKIILLR